MSHKATHLSKASLEGYKNLKDIKEKALPNIYGMQGMLFDNRPPEKPWQDGYRNIPLRPKPLNRMGKRGKRSFIKYQQLTTGALIRTDHDNHVGKSAKRISGRIRRSNNEDMNAHNLRYLNHEGAPT